MTYVVQWSEALTAAIAARYEWERTPEGAPAGDDFVNGPLAVATVAFRQFDALPPETGPSVRSYHTFHPFFGPVVFFGVLVDERTVEVAAFDVDDDYWHTIGDDPSDD